MKKKTVIKKLEQARQEILDLIEPLPENKWNEIFLGKWSLKDFVAHLIGWDIRGLKATREIVQGKLPSYYECYDEGWRTINDQLVKQYKKGNKKELIAAVKEVRHKLAKELENIPEELYHKDFGIRWKSSKITLASDTLFQANDEKIHTQQIKRWIKTGKKQ